MFERSALFGAAAYLLVFGAGLVVEPARAGVALQLLDSEIGKEPADIVVSPDDLYVYVADHDDSSVVAFVRNGDGLDPLGSVSDGVCTAGVVGQACTGDTDCGNGATGACRRSLHGAKTLAITPDGACVYAGSDIDDSVTILSRDSLTGALTLSGLLGRRACSVGRKGAACESDVDCESSPGASDGVCLKLGLRGVTSVVLSPDGANVYVAGKDDDTVTVFSRVAPGCDLTLVQRIEDGLDSTQLDGPDTIVASPDGANVYVSTALDESIVAFARSITDGTLSRIDVTFAAQCVEGRIGKSCDDNKDCGTDVGRGRCEVQIPTLSDTRGIALSPDGFYLYVAGAGLPIFARDPVSGLLSLSTELDLSPYKIKAGSDVVVTSDGSRLLYATAEGQLLVAFSRDILTGNVSIEHSHGPIDVSGLAVSTDGQKIFASGDNTHATNTYGFIDTIACPAAPRSDCHVPSVPQASTLVVKNSSVAHRDAIEWKWGHGDASPFADVGDPEQITSYAFCLYDASGEAGATSLTVEGRVAPGGGCAAGRVSQPCWKVNAPRILYQGSNGIPARSAQDRRAGQRRSGQEQDKAALERCSGRITRHIARNARDRAVPELDRRVLVGELHGVSVEGKHTDRDVTVGERSWPGACSLEPRA